jgi:hypothetical protein
VQFEQMPASRRPADAHRSRAERIALMPAWPARMGEDMASLYLGVSLTKFRERVDAKVYPQPVTEGRRKLWAKVQLDRFIAEQFRLPVDESAGDGPRRNSWDDS